MTTITDEELSEEDKAIKKMIECLKFYATKNFYLDMPPNERFRFNATIDRDMGDKARKCLEEVGKINLVFNDYKNETRT